MEVLRKYEFDLNENDAFDCCKVCGYNFTSYETYFAIKNGWSGDDFIICGECLLELGNEINRLENYE